ncbi:MAG: hypothetical protein PQJ50_03565, partial [Spirochaetales bacterium]|nr:hypothetical protein [Spirochaetales bacterium]
MTSPRDILLSDVSTVPAEFIGGVIAVRVPEKVMLSVLLFPRVRVPVLIKEVLPAMLLEAPRKLTPYPCRAVVNAD